MTLDLTTLDPRRRYHLRYKCTETAKITLSPLSLRYIDLESWITHALGYGLEVIEAVPELRDYPCDSSGLWR